MTYIILPIKSHFFKISSLGAFRFFILDKIFYPMKSLILISKYIILYEVCKENWDADKLQEKVVLFTFLFWANEKKFTLFVNSFDW